MTATIHDASFSGSPQWRLTGTVGSTELDVRFSVPASYQWSRHIEASKLLDPCGGPPTMLIQTDGTLGKVFGRPTMWLRGSAASTALADLESAWAKVGPWSLYTPTDTGGLSVVCDPTQGDFTKQNQGSHWEVSMGFQAV